MTLPVDLLLFRPMSLKIIPRSLISFAGQIAAYHKIEILTYQMLKSCSMSVHYTQMFLSKNPYNSQKTAYMQGTCNFHQLTKTHSCMSLNYHHSMSSCPPMTVTICTDGLAMGSPPAPPPPPISQTYG